MAVTVNFSWLFIPNFVPNFANSLPSSQVHNEIHKQVCKQSLWLAIKSSQPIKCPVYKPVCEFIMNFWTWQRMCEVRNTAAQSYPVLLITLYLYINSILKIIRKSCVINLLRYIFSYIIVYWESLTCVSWKILTRTGQDWRW
jgi:hypothetical protein